MRCPRCGHENAVEMKFCGECGTRLTVLCAEPIKEALQRVAAALRAAPHFDPATMRRNCKLRGVDYLSYLVIAPTMARSSKSAPEIVVRCVDAQIGSIPELLQAEPRRFRHRSHASA